MKKIILIKQINNVQAGHLYEHIFCMQLAEYFRSNSLYSYIDYRIDAKTFYNGYVKIEVNLYTKNAIRFEKKITTVPFLINEDVIAGAILQIMAEKQMNFQVTDYNKLENILNAYDSQLWQTLDEVAIYNLPQDRESLIELTPRESRHFLSLKQIISMNKSSSEDSTKDNLEPLFIVISQVLTNNLQQIIADTSYCYSLEDFVENNSKRITHTNLYRIDKRQNIKLTIEKELAEELVKELMNNGLVSKLESFLKSVSYDNPMLAPDDDYISESTGLLVGTKGWRLIGTKANILYVLRHMNIDFYLAKTHQTVSLENIIES